FGGAERRGADRHEQRVVDRVTLVGPIEADQRHVLDQLIGDQIIAHKSSLQPVTISASTAVTPSPLAWTKSGLISISLISGTVRISRPTRAAVRASASTSAGGAPRNPWSSFAVRSLNSSSAIAGSGRSGGSRRTSPSASTQMPPRPTSTTGPHCG